MSVQGIDVSRYQQNIDWEKVKKQDILLDAPMLEF